MTNKTAALEHLAGLWIFAKASTIFARDDERKEAWAQFESYTKWVMAAFHFSDEQLAVDLKQAAAELYDGELKNEIFGYERTGDEKAVA